jgi:multicomponent Na+:H+ antiporter subunit G
MAEFGVFDWISWACILGGAFFSITGAFGILRLPDVFSRMHAAGIIDTLGCWLILIGLMFQADTWIVIVKLVLIIVFISFTSPTTTYALSRAAVLGGIGKGPKHALQKNKDAKPSNT